MDYLNISNEELIELGRSKREEYSSADPFPHIYLDNIFNPDYLKKIISEFPDLGGEKADIHYKNANENKYASRGENRFSANTKSLFHYLNSQPFLEFLQEISGINEALIPDPYLEGGGLHQIKDGGFLKVHVDFHSHKKMSLDRRLNAIVYLNDGWKDEYGGHLELWERDMSKSAVKIPPVFNRLVIFSTTDYSWHGHPDPIQCPDEVTRRSMALYYYTNGRPESEISLEKRKRVTTTFASRKGQDSANMKVHNTMVNLANDWLPPAVVRMIQKVRNT